MQRLAGRPLRERSVGRVRPVSVFFCAWHACCVLFLASSRGVFETQGRQLLASSARRLRLLRPFRAPICRSLADLTPGVSMRVGWAGSREAGKARARARQRRKAGAREKSGCGGSWSPYSLERHLPRPAPLSSFVLPHPLETANLMVVLSRVLQAKGAGRGRGLRKKPRPCDGAPARAREQRPPSSPAAGALSRGPHLPFLVSHPRPLPSPPHLTFQQLWLPSGRRG